MKVTRRNVKVRDVYTCYDNNKETGRVTGYLGTLDIRPEYQREFVYKDAQRNAVIETVLRGLPLNVFYWAVKDDGTYEIMDGQQRTISLCEYCNNEYSIKIGDNQMFFHNLTSVEKDLIMNYELDVYICEGTDREKLEWFKCINIAGERLTDQELRNAVYSGAWLTDAKKRFSAKNCSAERIAKPYMSGVAIRQEYLETVLNWAAKKDGVTIEEYMAKHQHDANAGPLWSYFSSVIEWVKSVFTVYRKEMRGVQWGLLYNKYGTQYPDTAQTEEKIKKLMMDDDVTSKKGVYEYILSGSEKVLSLRTFTESQKREAYERQNGICPKCNKHFDIKDMHGDHITPWCQGGHTTTENLQMLCADCNRRKSGT